jgi:hypothetical protein
MEEDMVECRLLTAVECLMEANASRRKESVVEAANRSIVLALMVASTEAALVLMVVPMAISMGVPTNNNKVLMVVPTQVLVEPMAAILAILAILASNLGERKVSVVEILIQVILMV